MNDDGQDTIVTDVETNQESNQEAIEQSADEQVQVATGIPSQRAMAMQRIVESRRSGDEDTATTTTAVEVKDVATVENQEVVEPEAQDADVVTLKVDGQEMQVPKAKVLEAGTRALQKESAADKRLREVSAKEAELERRANDLARMEADLLTKRNQQTDIEPDATGREFADALFTDDEKVAKTITAITKKLNEVSTKVAQVEQIETQKAQSDFQAAVKHYHDTYGDIASDPDLHLVMNNTLRRVAAENPDKSRREVVDLAAQHVYGKFGLRKDATQAKEQPPPQNSRKQAKEKMPAPLRTASARVEPPPAPTPKTPAQVLDQMRQNRVARAY